MGHRILALGPLLAGLVVATMGGALTAADAAAPATGTPRAPVIRESFTPLPCQHGTTVGEEGCAEQRILRTDRQIDTLNAEIFKRLDAAGRKDFVTGHHAWFAYRKAYCASESDIYRGGTEAGVVAAQCDAKVNTAHLKELNGFLAGLSQA